MTNTLLQDKLGFYASVGTRDTLSENKMVHAIKSVMETPTRIVEVHSDTKRFVKNSIQLSLF